MRGKRRLTSQSRAMLLTSQKGEEDFILAVWFRSVNLPDVPGKSHLSEPGRIDSAHQWGRGASERGERNQNNKYGQTSADSDFRFCGMVPDRGRNRKLRSSHFQHIITLLWGGHSSAVDIVGPKSRWK